MAGEVLHQLDLFFCEQSYFLPKDDDAADHIAIFEHRHADDGARASKFYGRNAQFVAVCRLGRNVGNLIGMFGLEHLPEAQPRIDAKRRLAPHKVLVGRRRAVGRTGAERIPVPQKQVAEFGAANANCVLQDGREHRLEIAR